MPSGSRELYSSSNGDVWRLVREGDRVFIWHQPNASSGGRSSEIDLAAFLTRGQGPEQQALVRLIGSLLDESNT